MAYVYRHIRLDKNVPFYVGVGTDNKGHYSRAFTKKARNFKNTHWGNIIKKTPYEVEIMIDDVPLDFAFKKEKEFISLYGRSDLGKGTLVNKTNGGEGVLGLRCKEKTKKQYRELYSKKICQYDLTGVFIKVHDSATAAAKDIGSNKSHICHCANGTQSYRAPKGFVWRWFNGSIENISNVVIDKRSTVSPLTLATTMKSVDQFTIGGVFVKTFESFGSAAKAINVTRGCIADCIKGRQKTSGGFIWKHSKIDNENNN